MLAAMFLGSCCLGPRIAPHERSPDEVRVLVQGTIDGAQVTISEELRAWHADAQLTDRGWTQDGDVYSRSESVAVARGRLPLPRYDLDGAPPLEPIVRRGTAAEGRAELASLAFTSCTIEHGLVYRIGDRPWTVLWLIGDRVLRAAPPLTGRDCTELAVPDRNTYLAAHPGGATICLALDEDGDRLAALDCLASGADADLVPAGVPRGEITYRDRDTLVSRLLGDPASLAGYENRILEREVDPNDTIHLLALLAPIEAARGLDGLARHVAASCAAAADRSRPCTATMVALAALALRTGRSPDCARISALASTVRASTAIPRAGERGRREALALALLAVRGAFECDTPELRALALEGLGTATSADVHLADPAVRSYDAVDPDCQPYPGSGGRPSISTACLSYPRFAGTWLAARCGQDAVVIAREIAAGRPREPFDPREDQVLDGALRVLASCDPPAFEAAIASAPTTTLADIRSREHLRAAYARLRPAAHSETN